ncbi:MAG: tripartite tricarboxylate transporter permease [Nitrospirota bacterium]
MGDVATYLFNGLIASLHPLNILMIFFGLAIGMVAGVLPGITMVNAIVLVLPFTYFMDITPALLLMIGIYCGGCYAGTITGILFNIPGDPMNVPQTWEGYALKKKGLGSIALGVAITTSAIGGLASGLIMTFASPPFIKIALQFSSVEYFAIVFFGLTSVVALATTSVLGAFISMLIGMFLATVGVDPHYGTFRFSFGTELLETGIDFIIVMIGLFAIGEILDMLETESCKDITKETTEKETTEKVKVKTNMPRPKDLWHLRGSISRGLGMGTIIGMISGAGAAIAAFVTYGVERQVRKAREKFGSGSMAGLAAPETAANASTGGAMMALLSLGIPGSAAAAVMLGAFKLKGINPGPLLFAENPHFVYTIFVGFLLTNFIMIFMGIGAAKVFAQLLRVPYAIMASFIVVFCSIGAFALRNDVMDIWLAMIFGIVGYLMRRMKLPVAPMVLGLILGPLAEDYFRVSMTMHQNNLLVFFTRPISAVFMVISFADLLYPLLKGKFRRQKS